METGPDRVRMTFLRNAIGSVTVESVDKNSSIVNESKVESNTEK